MRSLLLTLALLLLLSCKPTLEYNNFIFEKVEGLWKTEWQYGNTTYILTLRYNPYEVENVPITGRQGEIWNRISTVYITFNPLAPTAQFRYLTLAASELGLALSRALQRYPIGACTVNATEACSDRPIINCSYTEKPVLQLEPEGEAEIVAEGNCIRLRGQGFELVKAVDKLLYKWLGIMP